MTLDDVLGTNSHSILWWQMILRAVVVFVYGLLLIRFAGKRVFGKGSALDLVVYIMVGSNFSRALTGSVPLGATLVATTALVALHWVVARLTVRLPAFEWLVKGQAEPLVIDGQPLARVMARHGISASDLDEAARQAGLPGRAAVSAAYVERNGRISVVRR